MSAAAILAETLYDGLIEAAQPNRLVRVENGLIVAVEPPPATLPEGTRRTAVLAPGFIDLQINGAADRLFNDTPDVETIARIAWGARQGGTAHLLPTFITEPGRLYEKALDAVEEAIAGAVPGILGVHLEGPFISPLRPGIHPRLAIRPLEAADCARIAAAPFLRLVTLAPEEQDTALLARLAASGVVLFAGHSEASAQTMRDEPLRGATHLFNAMPPLAGRAPGIVGAALTDPRLSAGIIADGLHVDPVNLALAAQAMPERLCLVTDAMPTLAGTQTRFTLLGTEITLGDDGRLTGPDGTLAGAHLAMDEAVRNMVRLAGVSPGRAIMMASRNPARALGLDGELGVIREGHRASFTLLDADLKAEGVMVDGVFPD